MLDVGYGVVAFELVGLKLDLMGGKLVSSANETSVKKLCPESYDIGVATACGALDSAVLSILFTIKRR